MTPEEYKQVADVFAKACERDASELNAFLDEACGADVELRKRVEVMLRSDASGEAFMRNAAVLMRNEVESALTDAHAVTEQPRYIGRYRIIRKLGDGGMGTVYLAEQDQPKRMVAVKVIRSGLMSRELLHRFEFEAQVLGQLHHPGIAHVYEASTSDSDHGGQSYFAMEYIEGPTLDKYVEEHSLGVRKRLELAALVCDAIQYAHQRGVIHRDLKPGNILVDASGQPKVLDFGVARATNSDTQLVTMQTNIGQLVGTLPYMSPEQVNGVPVEIDTRSDVYALGVISFELLADRLPYQVRNLSVPEAARVIRDDEPSRLSSVDASLRGDVETIVAKALEKDKSRRYQTSGELAADIRRYLGNEPIVARPASTMYQLKKFAMRNRALTAALCGVVFALVAGLISSSIYAVREHRQRQIAEQRFEDLRTFAQKVIVDYQNLQRAKGETKAREYLSTTAQDYLDKMAQDTNGLNLDVLADLGKAYTAIGDIFGQPNSPNLGDREAAEANYQKSVAIYADIVDRDPANYKYKRELAIGHERIGNLYLSDLRFDDALACYRKSHDIKLAIAGDDPSGQRNLSYSYNKLGDVYIKIDREDEALEMYSKSLAIRKRQADESPENESIQRSYTVGINRVGDVLMELDRIDEALEQYAASLARRVARVNRQPDNTQARMDAAVGYLKHGQGFEKVGRGDEALAAFESARSILQKMADDDPSNNTARLGAAQMSGQIGRTLFDVGQFEDAAKELASLIHEVESTMPDEKLSVSMRQLLAETHHLYAQALLKNPNETRTREAERCAALHRAEALYRSLSDNQAQTPPELINALASCP